MRLSVGAGLGPFRVSQTLAESGRRSRPTARQRLATESVKAIGQLAVLPFVHGWLKRESGKSLTLVDALIAVVFVCIVLGYWF